MESLTSIAHDLQLLRNETRHEISRLEQAANTAYALTMAIVLLYMQAGFAMLEVGSVRERAVRDVLFKNMVDISVAAIAWFLLGYLLYSTIAILHRHARDADDQHYGHAVCNHRGVA